jgi:hypothetical protein
VGAAATIQMVSASNALRNARTSAWLLILQNCRAAGRAQGIADHAQVKGAAPASWPAPVTAAPLPSRSTRFTAGAFPA